MLLILTIGIIIYLLRGFLPTNIRQFYENLIASLVGFVKKMISWPVRLVKSVLALFKRTSKADRSSQFKNWVNSISTETQEALQQNLNEDTTAFVTWLNSLDASHLAAFVKRVDEIARSTKINMSNLFDSKASLELKRVTEQTFLLYALSAWKAQSTTKAQVIQTTSDEQPAQTNEASQASRARQKSRSRNTQDGQTTDSDALQIAEAST